MRLLPLNSSSGSHIPLLRLRDLPPISSCDPQSGRAWEARGRGDQRMGGAGCAVHAARRKSLSPAGDWCSLRQRSERDVGSELGPPSCVSAERVFAPGARASSSSGAPAGLGSDGAGGGRGDRVLRGTCGSCRDGIGRGLALRGPPLPVAAAVWLGGPGPRRGSVRWVSAAQGPWGFLCYGWDARRSLVAPGSGGAWPGDPAWRREAEPLLPCVDSAQTRG